MAVFAVLALLILSAVLFFLFFMQNLEIKNISKQISDIAGKDSNELIHTKGVNTADMNRLVGEINGLLKQIRSNKIHYQRKSHDLEQMMANISHDLRTPLTSAMGYINIVINSDMPAEEKEREILIVEKRLVRLEELIDSFFELSKVISKNQLPQTEEINLMAAIEESVAHYYDDFCGQKRKIDILCDKSRICSENGNDLRHALNINSNRGMLIRIFDNLINNAYKHGIGDLKISVEAAANTAFVRFENELTDSELETDRIFDEFYTTDISRTKGNTGLGLAIAKQFTEILGGGIKAEYDGSVFSITVEIKR